MSKVHGYRVPVDFPVQSAVEKELLLFLLDRGGRSATQPTYEALADRLRLSPEQWTVQIETSTGTENAWGNLVRFARRRLVDDRPRSGLSPFPRFDRLGKRLAQLQSFGAGPLSFRRCPFLIINQPSASSCRVDTVHVNEEIDLVSGHVVRPTREQIRRKINKKITQRSNSTDRNTDGGASTWGARRNTDRLGNGNGLTRVSP